MEYLWDQWLERALARLESLKVKYVIKPITLSVQAPVSIKCPGMEAEDSEEFEKFDSLQPWDRSSLEVLIDESTFQKWLDGSSPSKIIVNLKSEYACTVSGDIGSVIILESRRQIHAFISLKGPHLFSNCINRIIPTI